MAAATTANGGAARTPARVITEAFTRPGPDAPERTRPFWQAGRGGELRIARCADCRRYCHPPLAVCPACQGRELPFEAVSGRGTVYSFTINRYEWQPGLTPPYVIAEIELAEQQGLRLLSSVVGTEPSAVRIGTPVEVCFARSGEAFIPLFQVVDS